jgi:serine protease Do
MCAFFAFVLGIATRLVADEITPVLPQLEKIFSGRSPKASDLKAMQEHLQRLAEKVGECTVHLRMGDAHGSGTLVRPEGIVLTAAHVVGLPRERVVVQFQDGRAVMGQVLGVDLGNDLALVQLNDRGPWPYLDLATNPVFSRGQWCAAAGHPGGFDLDRGLVFRVGRILHAGALLRTDCELIGGDSGGPLVDMKGQVIGVHSRIGISVLTNLHVPSTAVTDSWDGLASGKVLRGRAHLGIKASKEAMDCVVTQVMPGSAAEEAGIEVGDQITHFDGQRIRRFAELMAIVQTRDPGDQVTLGILRNGRDLELNVTIGESHGG